MDNILNAFTMIADPSVLGVIIASSLFGLFVVFDWPYG